MYFLPVAVYLVPLYLLPIRFTHTTEAIVYTVCELVTSNNITRPLEERERMFFYYRYVGGLRTKEITWVWQSKEEYNRERVAMRTGTISASLLLLHRAPGRRRDVKIWKTDKVLKGLIGMLHSVASQRQSDEVGKGYIMSASDRSSF